MQVALLLGKRRRYYSIYRLFQDGLVYNHALASTATQDIGCVVLS